MHHNPVLTLLGRRLRLAVIGGAPGAFIGGMHRLAARCDDRYQLVAGVLSSNPEKALAQAAAIGLPRGYQSVEAMLQAERQRPDGAEVVAIMTPNDSHTPYALAALEAGMHVICDKPLTNTSAEARLIAEKVAATGKVFCLTHNYSGYPMVRQARAMVAAGRLGEIRLVQVEYVQGNKADESVPDPTSGPRSWKFNPAVSGPSLVLGDIGTHAHHLLRYITGLEVAAVCGEAGAIVPGRTVDDFAGALLKLTGGGRGSFWVTQAAAGFANGLQIRVCGNRGSLEWRQEVPQRLIYKPLGAPEQRLQPNGPGLLPLAQRASRLSAGHPEGFPMAFTNLYSDAAEAIAAHLNGTAPDPLALHFPTAADGLAGLLFVEALLRSSQNGSWQTVDVARI